jgi:predicted dehydrogenase
VKVGLVGCGMVAQVMHLHYLRELRDRFEIAAICDLSPTVLEHVGREYGVERRFTDWRRLLEEPLDAVMVLTSGSHTPIAVAAAQAGRHVFIEKPIALSQAEGEEIIGAGKKAGVHLMVGYMKQYDPAVDRMREELRALSDLRAARTITLEYPFRWYIGHYPLVSGKDVDPKALDALRDEDDRRVSQAIPKADPVVRRVYRRVLLDSMIHDLNLIRSLLGEPDVLEYARLGEEGVTAVFMFGKVPCTMQWVNLMDGVAQYQQEFAFFGPKRSATLLFPSPFLRSMPTQLVIQGGEGDGPRSWRTTETVSYEEAFKRELLEFYDVIASDREPRTTATDAVRDVALCQALVAAHLARSKRP